MKGLKTGVWDPIVKAKHLEGLRKMMACEGAEKLDACFKIGSKVTNVFHEIYRFLGEQPPTAAAAA